MTQMLKLSDNLEVGIGVLARTITGAQMAELWIEWCNVNSQHREAKAFVQALYPQHNTLQSNVIRLLWQILRRIGSLYHDGDWSTDARNGPAVRACEGFYVWAAANSLDDWPMI